MNQFPLQGLLEELVDFFDSHGIDYMVMGGIAVRFWGIPRPTFDLDFTLAVEPEDVPPLCEKLRRSGFSVPEAHEKGFVDRLAGMDKFGVVRYEDGKGTQVDMFLVTTPYQREAFRRRVKRELNGKSAWMIAPEDLILHKLISGRDRDMGDVSDTLWMNPDLDRGYLRQWGTALGVSQALERKLKEFGL